MVGSVARETSIGGSRRQFEPTAWTLVLKARDHREWGALVELNWKPCYFYVRRKGFDIEDAKDLTQSFFADLMERGALASVTPSKGRFRSFLRACLDHFLANELDRRQARKRGAKGMRLDFKTAEGLLAESRVETAERSYERQWAVDLIERALRALKAELGPRFETLREYIAAGQPGRLGEVAARLGVTEGNVKVILHRARRRYGELLRAEVARTVEDPREIDDELKSIFAAL
jgi:RNA polymerase sigma-70 factor (ECF subfamily)